jgi:hypothetical protein
VGLHVGSLIGGAATDAPACGVGLPWPRLKEPLPCAIDVVEIGAPPKVFFWFLDICIPFMMFDLGLIFTPPPFVY